ncbi:MULTISPECIES: helix-turn-helix domain-containing protein [unclassified Sphingobium]|uniref:helix-turn-helix domain-containing protein n=1 Tax=Sphingobium TaxID=165695 RepID=UPI0015EC07BE|nr:excisionase family DNA binding protein [Sphingobium sp. B10D3B]MCW2403090.1 excisionase family DNA binding protein [Sphingobium sp. B10D7B]MCW2410069.1 excisionase family DNA binding protein [Sphingobium xanthum]
MTDEILLTPAEAAARLHISDKTLRRLRQQGHIRYVAITPRKIRYRPEDCDAYVMSRLREDDQCQSTSRKIPRSTSTTSSIVVADFTARRARKRNARRKL